MEALVDVIVNAFDSISLFFSDSLSFVGDFFGAIQLFFSGALEFLHYLPPQVAPFALLFLTSGVFMLIVKR